METYISADLTLIDDEFKENICIRVKDGRIEEILDSQLAPRIDTFLKGCLIPGLIDSHIHGYKGVEFLGATPEEIIYSSKELLASGVTSYYPTLQTTSEEQLVKTLENIGIASQTNDGARINGIFLEGPFLSEKYRGSQNKDYLKNPDVELLKRWQELSNNLIRKIAVAPELPGTNELISYATNHNIKVAIGHTDADHVLAKDTFDKGVKILVHTYNAMRPLRHREPGVLAEALLNDNVYAEIICDDHHVDPLMINMLLRLKGEEKIVLITDGTLAAGLSDGVFERDGLKILVNYGAVRTEDGTLAGSSLSLMDAVNNIMKYTGVSLESSIKMATVNPAKSMGVLSDFGSISEGSLADLVLIDDKLNVLRIISEGVLS